MAGLMVSRNSSDLHVEPVWSAGAVQVLVRIRQGTRSLDDLCRLPAGLHEPLVLEWIRLAGLSPEKRHLPQDGAARLTFGGVLACFRVAIVPTVFGEKIAIRSIPSKIPSLHDLGHDRSPVKDWMMCWRGLVIVSGPTGSGKSTTLAACVRELVEHCVNIITIEESMVYLYPHGVTQIEARGFSCADALRAVTLQDADVIVLSDLGSDPEVARLAVAAAETGHLVLVCMHARDAISPLYEFLDRGVTHSQLAANVNGIVSQHLVRRPCPVCNTVGCGACNGAGYTGRFGVHEYFTFTQSLAESFLSGATAEALKLLQ
jgi:type II secretory ATPase GspE/PulE/Tfp pilus assembly ATPase PilB-like protein